jgi:hypothetical protein
VDSGQEFSLYIIKNIRSIVRIKYLILKYLTNIFSIFSKGEVIEIFCTIDNFGKEFESRIKELKQVQLNAEKRHRNRSLSMSDSEILTSLICFHLVHKKHLNIITSRLYKITGQTYSLKVCFTSVLWKSKVGTLLYRL